MEIFWKHCRNQGDRHTPATIGEIMMAGQRNKFRIVGKILQAMNLWELWKRRNVRRHDQDISVAKLIN